MENKQSNLNNKTFQDVTSTETTDLSKTTEKLNSYQYEYVPTSTKYPIGISQKINICKSNDLIKGANKCHSPKNNLQFNPYEMPSINKSKDHFVSSDESSTGVKVMTPEQFSSDQSHGREYGEKCPGYDVIGETVLLPTGVKRGSKEVKRRGRRGTYVYNPKPIIKKSKINNGITDKDEYYKRKRCMNNEAAKRSRQSRREKEIEIVAKEATLKEENESLQKRFQELKKKNQYLESLFLRKFK